MIFIYSADSDTSQVQPHQSLALYQLHTQHQLFLAQYRVTL